MSGRKLDEADKRDRITMTITSSIIKNIVISIQFFNFYYFYTSYKEETT